MIKAFDTSYSAPHQVYIVGVVDVDHVLVADPNHYRSGYDSMALRAAKCTDIVIPRPRISLFDTPEKERING